MTIGRREFGWLLGGAAAGAAQQTEAKPELTWHDARQFTLEGQAFRDVDAPYDRLPGRARGVVRDAVWSLSRQSAGLLVRFVAHTTSIHARWSLGLERLAGANSTAVASSGLDLYVKSGAAQWRWLGIGRATKYPDNVDALAPSMTAGEREYMLYLPMGNELKSLEIGFPKGSTAGKAPARPAGRKPVVFYGTSITHGYSASRSGMTHVSLLGRWLDREVFNLGFSGNGKMEPEVTRFLVELDPAVFVIDCLPNMVAAEVRERTVPIVKTLRAAHPKTPILLVEDRNYADSFLNPQRRERNETNHVALREEYAKLKAEKVPGVAYLEAARLLGGDGEGTIDGSHPTDLGFVRQAEEFAKALRPLLR